MDAGMTQYQQITLPDNVDSSSIAYLLALGRAGWTLAKVAPIPEAGEGWQEVTLLRLEPEAVPPNWADYARGISSTLAQQGLIVGG